MRRLIYLIIALVVSIAILAVNANAAFDRVDRKSFNKLAQRNHLPLFWRADEVPESTQLNPSNLAFLQGMRSDKTLGNYVNNGQFTNEFANAYEEIYQLSQTTLPDPNTITDPEKRRRALVIKELDQAVPTLIETDFSKDSIEDQTVVSHLLNVASLIENVYLRQNGVFQWDAQIPADDKPSAAMFYRNHGPFCLNPLTEGNPDCNALPSKPKRIVGIYPAALQRDKTFCELLQKEPNAAELSEPFAVVIDKNSHFASMPYTLVYPVEMHLIADELKATAASIKSPNEAAFKTYLLAAAQAFNDNNWYAADEAWTKMNALNSKWYLRVGPDEQYWEPCSLKAGFHLSFAKINPDSLVWQKKLDPYKEEMEGMLAVLAGPPYQPRNVSFHLPDFIDIVLNAGDSRSHTGATIGQSLPNSGPVANQSRGRTVVMTNLTFPDADSKAKYLFLASALLCKQTMSHVTADSKLNNMMIVLHEAAHNLGPAHQYTVNGKRDYEIFGGPIASMLEELKAETSAHYFTDWLVSKQMIDSHEAYQAHLHGLLWGFGHISKGMYDAEGKPKTYSQLAAIQFGTLIKTGAVVWKADEIAANGTDKGCLEADAAKFITAMAGLEQEVLQIKGKGDKSRAEALKKEMIDENDTLKQLRSIITERRLREPSSTLVYSIR